MRLSNFRVLTFDCYGTLIDWETGIFTAMQPLLRKAAQKTISRETALETFARHEASQEEETPTMIYSELLAIVHQRLAREWGVTMDKADHSQFGASVPDWPSFPDSAAALAYLKQHYQLVVLSNVDRDSFKGSNRRLGVTFDAIYTAQDIGAYKPNLKNFEYLLEHLAQRGVSKTDILHTAQSLFHDHAPAKRFGLASVWIDRRHDQQGWGATVAPPEGVTYNFCFPSLAAMVAAHQAEQE